jgi:hypothetical protein
MEIKKGTVPTLNSSSFSFSDSMSMIKSESIVRYPPPHIVAERRRKGVLKGHICFYPSFLFSSVKPNQSQ